MRGLDGTSTAFGSEGSGSTLGALRGRRAKRIGTVTGHEQFGIDGEYRRRHPWGKLIWFGVDQYSVSVSASSVIPDSNQANAGTLKFKEQFQCLHQCELNGETLSCKSVNDRGSANSLLEVT